MVYFNSQHLKEKPKNSNNMESLTLQVDGPITGSAYKHAGWGEAYNRGFTVSVNPIHKYCSKISFPLNYYKPTLVRTAELLLN